MNDEIEVAASASEENDNVVPTSFWVFAGAALMWNLIGLVIYYTQVTTETQGNPAFTELQQEFFASTPMWATAAWGLAVTAGVLGSLLLLMRKAWAVPMFIVSLVAVIVQNVHAFGMANAYVIFGTSSTILPSLILLVGIALIFYSRTTKAKGWIS